MPTGDEVVSLAQEHVGERYVFGVVVPKENPNWSGPWDCAEFATWLVFTATRQLYGVAEPDGALAFADAWTGYWMRDSETRGTRIPVAEAAACPGAFVLRHSATAGHIVLSDGRGGTVEAQSSRTGVVRGSLANRRWDAGVLVPWIEYTPGGRPVAVPEPRVVIFRNTTPSMRGPVVRRIQRALRDAGFDPGAIDGDFGGLTEAAVRAYQATRRLVADGEVGPRTAKSLGVVLPHA
jgi:N-acetylmuramoyl-L-alanine amidase